MEFFKAFHPIQSLEFFSMLQLIQQTANLSMMYFSRDLRCKQTSLKYVYTADIQKIYRQINVHDDHRRYQRIIWRFSEDAS